MTDREAAAREIAQATAAAVGYDTGSGKIVTSIGSLALALETSVHAALLAAEQRGRDAAVPAGWRPIETAPKDGTPVLVWDESMGYLNRCSSWPDVDDRRYAIGYCRPDGTWGNRNSAICRPTHWQPLPAAPQPKESPRFSEVLFTQNSNAASKETDDE